MSQTPRPKSPFWPAISLAFARLFIQLGLPLLAWGLNDLAGFFANPARAAYAAVVVVQAVIYGWLRWRVPPHVDRQPHLDWARWHAMMFEAILILGAYGDRRNIATWADIQALRWIGLAIYVVGICIAVWATSTWVNHLRREGANAYGDPVLLVVGPYRWIRFPNMLALVLYGLGVAMLFRSWIGLILLLPLIAAVMYRIRLLERLYADEYPRDWPRRSHTSKRLIPFLV